MPYSTEPWKLTVRVPQSWLDTVEAAYQKYKDNYWLVVQPYTAFDRFLRYWVQLEMDGILGDYSIDGYEDYQENLRDETFDKVEIKYIDNEEHDDFYMVTYNVYGYAFYDIYNKKVPMQYQGKRGPAKIPILVKKEIRTEFSFLIEDVESWLKDDEVHVLEDKDYGSTYTPPGTSLLGRIFNRFRKRVSEYSGRKYQFITSCINAPSGEVINEMTGQATQITYDTFMSYVDREIMVELFPDYEWGSYRGLRMKDDYAVSFHKSIYMGKPCVYVQWSRIEFIFIKE